MASLVVAYQTILVNGQWPQWGTLLPVIIVGLVLCLLGVQLFLKRAGEMVDEL
jgi:lipopolysaccharide transport system permease protein